MSVSFSHAARVILKNTGERVTFGDYGEQVVKFGRNEDVDTAEETVWLTGGTETLPAGNTIDTIVSAAADTCDVTVVGHTLAAGVFTRVEQTVTLTGTTPKALATPLARVERGFVSSGTAAGGIITVYVDGGATHLTIRVAAQQSEKCAFTVPGDEWLLLQQVSGGLLGTSTASVDLGLQTKAVNGVWRDRFQFVARATGSSFPVIPFEAPFLIGPNTDIRLVGTASTTNQTVVGTIQGTFGLIIG